MAALKPTDLDEAQPRGGTIENTLLGTRRSCCPDWVASSCWTQGLRPSVRWVQGGLWVREACLSRMGPSLSRGGKEKPKPRGFSHHLRGGRSCSWTPALSGPWDPVSASAELSAGKPWEYTGRGLLPGPVRGLEVVKTDALSGCNPEGKRAQALEGGPPEQWLSPGTGSGQREKEGGEGSGPGTEAPSGSQLGRLHSSLTPGPAPAEAGLRAS